MTSLRMTLLLACALPGASIAAPIWLDDQFELPFGFHIYKAAPAQLSGGSYAITLDGLGRVLVGDGQALRRLIDDNGDGLLDSMERIAEDLGPRGPQGLLVYGDRLFAIGGDGLQLYTGYQGPGPLRPLGRIGARFQTGGDHTAHTLLRGHDGYVYLVTGDGGGVEDRLHITEETSPAPRERAASVFRVSPDGARWECVASGGRNPPSLGMNYLGDLFSWDSDMEWHVDVPWYRPVRLNHWVWGSDQGWQSVGAYPSYFVDTLEPVLETGRGSPNWGVFYEHSQWPERFHNAFLVCDYPWKSASSGRYNTTGRLVSFHLRRHGGGWNATMDMVTRPKPGARDDQGRPIQFALVDVTVAPDGSLFLSDHNQGIWRLVYNANTAPPSDGTHAWTAPWIANLDPSANPQTMLDHLLRLPQPGAEWSRLRGDAIVGRLGTQSQALLEAAVHDSGRPFSERLAALRWLSPSFASLSEDFLNGLAASPHAELRGQAAWLLAWRGGLHTDPRLLRLMEDADPFVRRRAVEGLQRGSDTGPVPDLLDRLKDEDRLVRYAAMTALARRPSDTWLTAALREPHPQARLRGLTALHLQGSTDPLPREALLDALTGLLPLCQNSAEDELDLLRVLSIYQSPIRENSPARDQIAAWLTARFPASNPDIRWEQARLLATFQVSDAFAKLLEALEREPDPRTQFHLAQTLAQFDSGWTGPEANRLKQWFLQTQSGWFVSTLGKGRQFPDFWKTVVDDYSRAHRETLLADLDGVDYLSPLGEAVLARMAERESTREHLRELSRQIPHRSVQRTILRSLGEAPDPATGAWLRARLETGEEPELRPALLACLARMPADPANGSWLREGVQAGNLDTAIACAHSLARSGATLDSDMATQLLRHAVLRPESSRWISPVLASFHPSEHPDWIRQPPERRRDGQTERLLDYWLRWYETSFKESFPKPAAPRAGAIEPTSHSVETLLAFLTSEDARGGRAVRGLELFIELQCATCHGGDQVGTEGGLFGPDLTGVTQRLNRQELAESLVLPSKTVAERFKAVEITLKSGMNFTGFVTGESTEAVTLSTQEGLRRLAREEIEQMAPQASSLMPEGLLNHLAWDQIRDLFAYLQSLDTLAETPAGR